MSRKRGREGERGDSLFKGRTLIRSHLIAAARTYSKDETDALNERYPLYSVASYCATGTRKTLSGIGERRFILYEDILERGWGINWTRALAQREFHDLVSNALSKVLLGDDYARVGSLISKVRHWPRFKPTVLCRAPRRFGKSVASAMIVCAIAEALSYFPLSAVYRISVFATGGRISAEMAEYVQNFLNARKCKFRKTAKHNIKLRVQAQVGNYEPVIIDFYPSKSQTLRGVNSDLIIVDEAAHIDPRLWYETIVPIFGMANTNLIMISSPMGHGNFFSQLLDLKYPTGEGVFATYSPDMICRRCRASGNRDVMVKCRHKLHYLPRWKSEEKLDTLQKILEGEVEIHMRENFGEIVERGGSHFTESALDDFMKSPHFVPDSAMMYPKYVVITVDPNGSTSATSSEMAICALARFSGFLTICGISSYKTADGDKTISFLRAFVEQLRNIPCLRESIMVFSCERGSGHDSSFLARELKVQYSEKCMLVTSQKDDGYGFWSSNRSKVTQLEETATLFRYRLVFWLKDWAFSNGHTDQTRESVAGDLRSQLYRYGLHEMGLLSKTPKVSGQIDESGRVSRTLRDDMADALCFGCTLMSNISERNCELGLDYDKLLSGGNQRHVGVNRPPDIAAHLNKNN